MPLRNALLLLSLCLCVPALASCSDQRSPSDGGSVGGDTVGVADDAAHEISPDVQAAADASMVPATEGPTHGGDGSQIALQPLSADQLDGVDLPGELACSFADAGGATLLLARADVLPDGMVRGVLNNNGYAEMLGNGRAGGFNDLADGITLSGKGLVVELQRGESRPTGNEATQHVATLKVQRADGAERIYDGTLTCGP
ncbi:hypothetical protein ACW7G0_07360 [Lysobacter sp. A286]